jgi:hypothetical protein
MVNVAVVVVLDCDAVTITEKQCVMVQVTYCGTARDAVMLFVKY